MNGGRDAYVVRVAQGAAPAQVTLNDVSGNPALVVSAASPGAWGNNLRLDVDYATTNPDSGFNLTVARYVLQGTKFVATATEKYLNLTLNSRSANYALGVVNARSQLVQLALPGAGLNLNDATDRGWSLSGDLATFPTLTAQTTQIAGMLDGTTPFTLVLTGGLPNSPTSLAASVNNAIAAAGLSARLTAVVTDEFGVAGAGTYLKLESVYVAANPNTQAEFSSVQIIPAASNDASRTLTLGLSSGGREKDGASVRRPAQTGTASASLADVLGTAAGGALDVTINDNSSGTSVQIFTGTVTIPGTTVVGTALRDALQTAIRSLANAAAQQANVQLNGTVLRVVPSANTPNASIIFGNTGIAPTLHLTGAGSFNNVQQYSLGGGASFGAQTGAIAGNDGTPPNATQILGDYNAKTGLYALRDVDLFNLLVIPRTVQLSTTEANAVYAASLAFCEERRAFFLLDPDPTKTVANIGDWLTSTGASSSNGAVFFPQIQIPDPLNGFRLMNVPASATVAGVFARTDAQYGAWKAPAGIEAALLGAQGLTYNLTDPECGTLNPLGINCLRTFPVYGFIVWGGRTLRGADQMADDYKYTPVRRLALFLEESLYRGTQWVVFEPNDEPLWSQIRLNVGAFMQGLFLQGAFQGTTPQQAYFVKCDAENNPQSSIDQGIVNILVGFAPLYPAEFVVIQIQQMAGQLPPNVVYQRQIQLSTNMAQFPVNPTRLDPYKNFKFRLKWDGKYVCAASASAAA